VKAARLRSEGEVSCGNTGIDSNWRRVVSVTGLLSLINWRYRLRFQGAIRCLETRPSKGLED